MLATLRAGHSISMSEKASCPGSSERERSSPGCPASRSLAESAAVRGRRRLPPPAAGSGSGSVFQLAPAGASDQFADRRFELWKIVVNSSRHDCMGGVEVVVGETVTHLSDLRPWNRRLVTQ